MTEPDLRVRRDALAERAAQTQFHLGGLTYEMAIRDHFRIDVLVRRAAALQQLEAELGEVDRLLALRETATAGCCPSCRALHGHGAVFCWQCGHPLVTRSAVDGATATVETATLDSEPRGPRADGHSSP